MPKNYPRRYKDEWLRVTAAQNHMATTFRFELVVPHEKKFQAQCALDDGLAYVGRLEKELSEFRAESPVYQFNAASVGDRIPAPASTLELLVESLRLTELTDFAFNPFYKSHSRWEEPPLRWERTGFLIKTQKAHLSFGAIGKGFALQKVQTLLERGGFENYLLCAGGSSILMKGRMSEDTPWSWAWNWAHEGQGQKFLHESGLPIALGISGEQERGAHIQGAGSAVSSLVAHPSATYSDALSTALHVSGWDQTLQNLQALPIPPAMAVIEKEAPRWNGIFQTFFGAIASSVFVSFSSFAQEVDLESLGVSDFTPYTYERSDVWMLLPALLIAAVIIHLRKARRPSSKRGEPQ